MHVVALAGSMADHQSHKDRGMHDFPQKDRRTPPGIALLTSAVRIPKVREQVHGQLKSHMVDGCLAGVDEAEPMTADGGGE